MCTGLPAGPRHTYAWQARLLLSAALTATCASAVCAAHAETQHSQAIQFCPMRALPAHRAQPGPALQAAQSRTSPQPQLRPQAATQASSQPDTLSEAPQGLSEATSNGHYHAQSAQAPLSSAPSQPALVVAVFRWPAALSPSSVSVVGAQHLGAYAAAALLPAKASLLWAGAFTGWGSGIPLRQSQETSDFYVCVPLEPGMHQVRCCSSQCRAWIVRLGQVVACAVQVQGGWRLAHVACGAHHTGWPGEIPR